MCNIFDVGYRHHFSLYRIRYRHILLYLQSLFGYFLNMTYNSNCCCCFFAAVKTAIRDIKTMFYFNVTIDYHYCVNMTQSKEYSKVRKDIMKEIKKRLSAFNFLITYMSNFLMFTIIFIVIR